MFPLNVCILKKWTVSKFPSSCHLQKTQTIRYQYMQIWEAGVAACSFETRMSLNRVSRIQAPKRPSGTILNASKVGQIHNIYKKRGQYTGQYTNGIQLPKSRQVDPSNWDFLYTYSFSWTSFWVPKPTSSVSSSGSGSDSYPRKPHPNLIHGK